MNLQNQTTEKLEAREAELVRLTQSLAEWHNRGMSRRDRQFFAKLYRDEANAITEELIRRGA